MICWGKNDEGQTNVPRIVIKDNNQNNKNQQFSKKKKRKVFFKQVSAGFSHTCALLDMEYDENDENGDYSNASRDEILRRNVVCWGSNVEGELEVPSSSSSSTLSPSTSLSLSPSSSSSSSTSGSGGVVGVSTSNSVFIASKVVAGDGASCVIERHSRLVTCWGAMMRSPFGKKLAAIDLQFHGSLLCGLFDEVVTSTSSSVATLKRVKNENKNSFLMGGDDASGAASVADTGKSDENDDTDEKMKRRRGIIRCKSLSESWNAGSTEAQNLVRTIQGMRNNYGFKTIAVSLTHLCAVDARDEVQCWSGDADGEAKKLPHTILWKRDKDMMGSNNKRDRNSNDEDDDDSDENDSSKLKVESSSSSSKVSIRSMTCGADSTCIISHDYSLSCYGYGFLQFVDPNLFGSKQLLSVAVGDAHICGILKETNEVKCHGVFDDGRSKVPKPLQYSVVCFGYGALDPQVCSGRGSCVSDDLCICPEGFTGPDCSFAICHGINGDRANVCGGHGQCLQPDTCTCDKGYTGTQCESPICFGVNLLADAEQASAEVHSACSNNGQCISPDTCLCKPGYTGTTCSEYSCYGINSADPNVCSGKGKCTSVDTCECEEHSSGEQCEISECFGVLSTDPSVCHSNGKCVAKDTCQCKEGTAGDDCSVFACFGFPSFDSNVCSGRGSCVAADTCSCQPGYGGIECQLDTCFEKSLPYKIECECGSVPEIECHSSICSIRNHTNPPCNGVGTCVSQDKCACMPGYSGPECKQFTCSGISSMQAAVCSRHGTCVDLNKCECEAGYGGTNCEFFMCSSLREDDPNVCNGHGSCFGPNQCRCTDNYSGPNCESATCFGKTGDSDNICSGHGKCIAPDKCECQAGYTDEQCSTSICFGLLHTQETVCSGHGQCIGPDQCSCNPGYSTADCSQISCHGVLFNLPNTCSGNGKCIDADTCSCNKGYGGDNCEHPICENELANSPNVCSGRGTCTSPDSCDCNPGFYGGQCQFSKPVAKLSQDTFTVNCQSSILIDGSQSSYESEVLYAWKSVIPTDAEAQKTLNSFLKTQKFPILNLPVSYLPDSEIFTIEFSIFDRHRVKSNTEVATIQRISIDSVSSKILGPNIVHIRQSQKLTLFGVGSRTTCFSSDSPPLTFEWSLMSGPDIDITKHQFGTNLVFDENALSEGTYQFKFSVSDDPQIAESIVKVHVAPDNMKIRIVGADKLISPIVDQVLVIDAVEEQQWLSKDLNYVWTCVPLEHNLCSPAIEKVLEGASNRSELTIPANTLFPSSTYKFCAKVHGLDRVGTACSSLTTSAGTQSVVDVQIIENPLQIVSSTGRATQSLKFVAKTTRGSGNECNWLITNSPLSASTGITHSLGYSKRMVLYVYRDQLLPGNEYHVKIQCKNTKNNAVGWSGASFKVNPLPKQGRIEVYPNNGVALSTLFIISASQWFQTDSRLTYKWTIETVNGQKVLTTLATHENYFITTLPEGFFKLNLRVTDSYGTSRFASTLLTVGAHQTYSLSTDMHNLLDHSKIDIEGGVIPSSQFMILSDVIMTQMMKAFKKGSVINHDYMAVIGKLINGVDKSFKSAANTTSTLLDISYYEQMTTCIDNIFAIGAEQFPIEYLEKLFDLVRSLVQLSSDSNTVDITSVASSLVTIMDSITTLVPSKISEYLATTHLLTGKLAQSMSLMEEQRLSAERVFTFVSHLLVSGIAQRQFSFELFNRRFLVQFTADAENLLVEKTFDAEVFFTSRLVYYEDAVSVNLVPEYPGESEGWVTVMSPVFSTDLSDFANLTSYNHYRNRTFFSFVVSMDRSNVKGEEQQFHCRQLNREKHEWIVESNTPVCQVSSVTLRSVTCSCSRLGTFVVTQERRLPTSASRIMIKMASNMGIKLNPQDHTALYMGFFCLSILVLVIAVLLIWNKYLYPKEQKLE